MTKLAFLTALLLIGGCATIREHPGPTAFVVALVAGSVAASQNKDYRRSAPAVAHVGTPLCVGGTCQ